MIQNLENINSLNYLLQIHSPIAPTEPNIFYHAIGLLNILELVCQNCDRRELAEGSLKGLGSTISLLATKGAHALLNDEFHPKNTRIMWLKSCSQERLKESNLHWRKQVFQMFPDQFFKWQNYSDKRKLVCQSNCRHNFLLFSLLVKSDRKFIF